MRKIIEIVLLSITLLFLYPYSSVHSAELKPVQVLIVYDSLAINSSKQGNIEALQRQLASFGAEVTVVSLGGYEPESMKGYQQVIGVNNDNNQFAASPAFLKDLEQLKGNYLHVGPHAPEKVQTLLKLNVRTIEADSIALTIGQFSQPAIHAKDITYILQGTGTSYGRMTSQNEPIEGPYGIRNDRYAYVPFYEKGNLSELAMSYLLRDWLAMTSPAQNYLLIKEIYPFSNLDMLMDLADRLYEAGIPFLVSARPVFSNFDYPSMKRYLEALKFVQSHNGSIIMNSPVVSAVSSIYEEEQLLQEQLNSFLEALIDYGITPLGMGTELYWSYDQHYREQGLRFFDSVVLFPNDKPQYRVKLNSSSAFTSSLYSLQWDELKAFKQEGKELRSFPMNTALTLDFPSSEEELEEIYNTLLNSWITFADYKVSSHTVQTKSHTVTSRNGVLSINGTSIDLNTKPTEISSEHSYVDEGKKSLTTLFSIQNNIFIVLILLTLVVFALFLIIGYRLYRKKYIAKGG